MKKAKLLVISGTSAGAGKDTLMNMFIAEHSNWYHPPSTTTRQIRPGEVDGKDYKFISLEQFQQWRDDNKFLESDFHAGNWYGTLREPIEKLLDEGKAVILRKDVNGAMSIKTQLPEATIVFIDVESSNVLEERIRKRHSESEEQIQQRLKLAKDEANLKDNFDYVIVNKTGQQDEALQKLEDIARSLDD